MACALGHAGTRTGGRWVPAEIRARLLFSQHLVIEDDRTGELHGLSQACKKIHIKKMGGGGGGAAKRADLLFSMQLSHAGDGVGWEGWEHGAEVRKLLLAGHAGPLCSTGGESSLLHTEWAAGGCRAQLLPTSTHWLPTCCGCCRLRQGQHVQQEACGPI